VKARGLLAWTAVLALLSCGGQGSTASVGPGWLLVVDVKTGSRVHDSAEVVAMLSGDLIPSRELIVAASCHNVGVWLDDWALNNRIVVGTSARLVRVAQMIAEAEVNASLAVVLEEQVWRGGQPQLTDGLREAGFDQGDVDSYVALSEQTPSAEAAARYVVYAVSGTTTEVMVSYLDTANLPTPRTVDRNDRQEFYVAFDGQLAEQTVTADECRQL
jgi:hypothetical protein